MAFVLLFLVLAFAPQTMVQVPVGAAAPAFRVADDTGARRALGDYRGKYVVLEWHEKGCPYVTKHYRGGSMQARQRAWMERGVVWLLVNSSADGFHSSLTPDASRAYRTEIQAAPTAMLLDTQGVVGRAYGVTTALHMVIVDPAGKVIYNGAIDDQPKTETASLMGAKNYVDVALTEALAARPISTTTSVPYGCEVHYAR